MNVLRSGRLALALPAALLAACSDRPGPLGPEAPRAEARPLESAPVALLAPGDPTGIPIGAPALIHFPRRRGVGRTVYFPQSPPAVDVKELEHVARDWLTGQKASAGRNPATAKAVKSIEALLAARTPEEIRAALGPGRARIETARSIKPIGSGLYEHTAAARLDGREVLRVVTRAGPRARASFECASDPNDTRFYVEGCEDTYDPSFDPEPVLADLAAMEASISAWSAEVAALNATSGAGASCQAQTAVFLGAAVAFGVRAGQTAFHAWTRNVPQVITGLRDSFGLYVAAYAAYWNYRGCVSGASGSKPPLK